MVEKSVSYLYHGTTSDTISAIAEHGLLRNAEESSVHREMHGRSPAVYVTTSERLARGWAEARQELLLDEWEINVDAEVLRFSLSKLPSDCVIEQDVLHGLPIPDSFTVFCDVPPDAIQVKRGQKWVSLREEEGFLPMKPVQRRRLKSVRVRSHRRRR